MKFKGLDICCPLCRGDLAGTIEGSGGLQCDACDRLYPVVFGIPDLRVFADPYIDLEADREKSRRLAGRFDDFDFEGFVAHYYAQTSVVPAKHARQYSRGLMTGVARAESALEAWLSRAGDPVRDPQLLEIGCGTAPLLVAAARRGWSHLAGLDIALRWLVVAKKRLAEEGLEEVPLICACAEALPLAGPRFDLVIAESVIEHLQDQSRALEEIRRVMRAPGRLMLSTPNRFSVGPDPHVGLWLGGYLPQTAVAAYARSQGAVPPRRRLLSRAALGRLLRTGGFTADGMFLPDFPAAQRAHFPLPIRLSIDAYHAVKRTPGIRRLLDYIGPLIYSVSVPAESRDVGADTQRLRVAS